MAKAIIFTVIYIVQSVSTLKSKEKYRVHTDQAKKIF